MWSVDSNVIVLPRVYKISHIIRTKKAYMINFLYPSICNFILLSAHQYKYIQKIRNAIRSDWEIRSNKKFGPIRSSPRVLNMSVFFLNQARHKILKMWIKVWI